MELRQGGADPLELRQHAAALRLGRMRREHELDAEVPQQRGHLAAGDAALPERGHRLADGLGIGSGCLLPRALPELLDPVDLLGQVDEVEVEGEGGGDRPGRGGRQGRHAPRPAPAAPASPARRAFARARIRSSASKSATDSCSRKTAPSVSPSRWMVAERSAGPGPVTLTPGSGRTAASGGPPSPAREWPRGHDAIASRASTSYAGQPGDPRPDLTGTVGRRADPARSPPGSPRAGRRPPPGWLLASRAAIGYPAATGAGAVTGSPARPSGRRAWGRDTHASHHVQARCCGWTPAAPGRAGGDPRGLRPGLPGAHPDRDQRGDQHGHPAGAVRQERRALRESRAERPRPSTWSTTPRPCRA